MAWIDVALAASTAECAELQRQSEVGLVELEKRLSGAHVVAGIDQALQNLAVDAEAEIAFVAGMHDTG